MNPKFIFLSFTIFLCVLPNLIAATNLNITKNETNLIEKVCGHSSHKQFCISSLKSDPSSGTSDITGLTFIALKVASSNAANTTSKIKTMLANPNLDPFTEQCLSDCSDRFADAVDQIDDSLVALSVNAYSDVNTWVKVAISDVESCEDGFKARSGYPNVLKGHTKALRMLCNNALIIAKQVQAKH